MAKLAFRQESFLEIRRGTEEKVQFPRKISIQNLYVCKPASKCKKQKRTGYRKTEQDVGQLEGPPDPSQGPQVTSTADAVPGPASTGTAVHPAARSTSFSSTCGILMRTGLASTFQRADIIQTFSSDHNGIKLEIGK